MKEPKRMPDLAGQVLALLGPGWKVAETCEGQDTWSDWATLEHSDGYAVGLQLSRPRLNCPEEALRVTIDGELPRRADGKRVTFYELHVQNPSISMALSRGPKAIAKEIERRFLPIWIPVWQKAIEMLRQRDDHARQREEARALLEATGLVRRTQHAPFNLVGNGGRLSADVEVGSADWIKVTITARSPEQAARILQATATAETAS